MITAVRVSRRWLSRFAGKWSAVAAPLGAILLGAQTSYAEKSAADGTRLEWIRLEGAEGCPARALFEQSVRTRMGGNPFSTSGKRTLTVELSSESGPFRAVLILKNEAGTGVDSRQELFSYSTACDELFGATVLSVSLLLSPRDDDDAKSDITPLPDDGEEENEDTPSGASKTPEPPRPTLELSPAESAVPEPTTKIRLAPRPWARTHSRAMASLVVALDQMPETTFGLAVRGEFPLAPQWLFAIEGMWLASRTAENETRARLEVGLSAAWVDAVWVMYRSNPLEVMLDIGAGLEVLHLSSPGPNAPSGDEAHGAGRVGLGLNLQVDSRVALCSAFSAVVVPEQPSFVIADGQVWQQTWLGGQLNFGLAIDFP